MGVCSGEQCGVVKWWERHAPQWASSDEPSEMSHQPSLSYQRACQRCKQAACGPKRAEGRTLRNCEDACPHPARKRAVGCQ